MTILFQSAQFIPIPQDYQPLTTCFYLDLTRLQENVPLHLLAQNCGFSIPDDIKSSTTLTFKWKLKKNRLHEKHTKWWTLATFHLSGAKYCEFWYFVLVFTFMYIFLLSFFFPVHITFFPAWKCFFCLDILNHTKFLQSILIHSSMYIDMCFHLYIFFTVFVLVCFVFLTVLIWSPTIVFQHFSKRDKQGWLTRWPPWSFTNPIWHSTTLCLHWSAIMTLCFHLFKCLLMVGLPSVRWIFVLLLLISLILWNNKPLPLPKLIKLSMFSKKYFAFFLQQVPKYFERQKYGVTDFARISVKQLSATAFSKS